MEGTYFHSTCKANRQSIQKNGLKCTEIKNPFEIEDNKLDWLGMGIYLWGNLSDAVRWSYKLAKENKNTNFDYIIDNYDIYNVKVIYDIDNYLDLSTQYGNYQFNKYINECKKQMNANNIKHEINYEKYSTRFWVSLLDYYEFWNKSNIYFIGGNFAKRKEINYKYSELIESAEYQYCIKNKDIINKIELNNDDNNISEYLSFILERNGGYYGIRRKDQYNYKVF